ncbi:SCO family protein [Isosphaeraceae bacterium EP7]
MNVPTLFRAFVLALVFFAPARAEDLRKRVGLDQLLGAQLPADALLKDESGADVRVGRFFGPRPLILTFVYFDCPMLCNEVTNAELRTLRALNLKLGQDYDVLTISIDPEDTPEKARARKARYLNRYDLPGADVGWHVLTGGAEASRRLAESVGFRYTYNKETRQFTHAAGLMVLTPDGKVARYFYGLSYPPRDVRLALTEASEGKLGSLTDQMLLFCYQYDPSTGRYTLAILNLVRVACVATVLALAAFIWKATRRDRPRAGPDPAFT